jgi:hypothetical protein
LLNEGYAALVSQIVAAGCSGSGGGGKAEEEEGRTSSKTSNHRIAMLKPSFGSYNIPTEQKKKVYQTDDPPVTA